MRQIRNKIHDLDHQFTEQELSLFSGARDIIYWINLDVMWPPSEEIAHRFKASAEKAAEQFLHRLPL